VLVKKSFTTKEAHQHQHNWSDGFGSMMNNFDHASKGKPQKENAVGRRLQMIKNTRTTQKTPNSSWTDVQQ
jgi:hypothetical protein